MLEDIQNIWLAIPALTALTIQLWLIFHSNKRKLFNRNWPILLFFIGVIGLTCIEFMTYIGIVSPNIFSMKLFYVFCSVTFSGILILAIKISGIKHFKEKFNIVIIAISSLLIIFSTFTLATNLVIEGVQSIGYSVTRVPGALYFIAQVYAAGLILLSAYFLIIGSHAKEDSTDKKRARVIILSTSPMFLIFLTLLVLMALGFKINASLIVPLALTYMLSVLIVTEQKENLFSLLIKIPYTYERKSLRQITKKIEDFLAHTDSGNQVSLKDLTLNIEQQIVAMAVQMSNGSQVKAASLLNVSASSICRKKKFSCN